MFGLYQNSTFNGRCGVITALQSGEADPAVLFYLVKFGEDDFGKVPLENVREAFGVESVQTKQKKGKNKKKEARCLRNCAAVKVWHRVVLGCFLEEAVLSMMGVVPPDESFSFGRRSSAKEGEKKIHWSRVGRN